MVRSPDVPFGLAVPLAEDAEAIKDGAVPAAPNTSAQPAHDTGDSGLSPPLATLPRGFLVKQLDEVAGVENGALTSPLRTTFDESAIPFSKEEGEEPSDEPTKTAHSHTMTPKRSTPTPQEPFPQELPGWNGYVEWERYPERKRAAAEILRKHEAEFDTVSGNLSAF